MEKKTFEIEYTETYANTYTVEAETFEKATEKLLEDIKNGRERGPEDCVNSDFEDVTEEESKLVSLTDTELSLLMECVLITLDQFDKAKAMFCNTAAVDVLEEQRKVYQSLVTILAEAIDRK